ncbi:msx2-interacting protein isoform X2 [Folsomia candida]|nr:msx2-interacting protein isoform X2 [Folsomia candida]
MEEVRLGMEDGEESHGTTGEELQGIINPPGYQVSPKADTLLTILQRLPIMWQGLLAVKNNTAASQMHFLSGAQDVAREALASNPDGTIPPLKITEKMQLEEAHLMELAARMQMPREHCVLLALPCGRDREDVLRQSNNLRREFITYFRLKEAAGIANIPCPLTGLTKFVIHLIPADCGFVREFLRTKAPELLQAVREIPYLLVVIARS